MQGKKPEKNQGTFPFHVEIAAFLSMVICMLIFEVLQVQFFPSLGVWLSILATISISSGAAFLGTFLLQKRNEKARSQWMQENEAALTTRMSMKEEYYQEILDVDPNLIYVKDQNGHYLLANQALLGFYGRSMHELKGKSDADLFIAVQESAASQPCEKETNGRKAKRAERRVLEEMRIHQDGETHWFNTTHQRIKNVEDDGYSVVSVATDICRLKSFENQLSHERMHDTLTGLPNHDLIRSYLEERRHLHSPSQSRFALLLIDIDQFKRVNESLGYNIGDKMIIAISKRFGTCVRSTDIIARFQGDAFVILLQDLSEESEGFQILDRIFENLSRPFSFQKQEISLTISVGVVFGQDPAPGFDEMLQKAEIAMNQAKRKGRQRYEVFDESMLDSHAKQVLLESDLKKAVELGQLRLHYQPIVSVDTGDVLTVEALVRWLHPIRGLIFPAEFIPFAEERDLIIPIGEWVLWEACCQTRKWQQQFQMKPDITVSVNISSKQLLYAGFIDQVSKILHESGLDPRHLKLEITESIYLGKSEQVVAVLNGLNALGVQLYIDDFGTGYSSLSYLSQLPFDAIKVDRSFIDGVIDRDGDMKIVEAIIRLAGELGKDLVAEGVETAEQRAFLKHLGCKFEQGYLFSPPLDSDDVEAFFSNISRL